MEKIRVYLSRVLAVIMSIVAMFSGGRLEYVTLSIVGEVSTQSEEIVYEIKNYSGRTITVDEYFTLEKKVGDEWVEMPSMEGVHDIAIIMYNFQTWTRKIDILACFGDYLEAGEYRLTKPYTPDYSFTTVFNVV